VRYSCPHHSIITNTGRFKVAEREVHFDHFGSRLRACTARQAGRFSFLYCCTSFLHTPGYFLFSIAFFPGVYNSAGYSNARRNVPGYTTVGMEDANSVRFSRTFLSYAILVLVIKTDCLPSMSCNF
jgi:hypothetical protein